MPPARRARRSISDQDYARLLAVRTSLRRFERWSAEQATSHGLTPAQHQLLLAIRGHDDPDGPTISEAAEYLFIKHHSAVELVDRSAAAGLVTRQRDEGDHRIVRLQLSPDGERLVADLSESHVEELTRLTPLFESLLDTLNAR
jgi:DNA-binding MarR family transcriptional regulator